ncbi:ESX-1 secretion-associated protein [Mycolicibacterium sp. P9-22]|uniref:ESX-1 secretion-associated protein n=1 Tax=Mycolicibacterium sp. P9-22 TaxID=2024613 RepID=UPI0011EFFFA2|nr:ESX-1 secretion-associated protein [Mycolicibacterium sp. P9-22]KAA0113679.1 ESX-1 secretion-associated protein [Mycolicibacterium sp. P9-22]
MTDPLFVQTDGVRNYSELHSQVGSGLSGLTSAEGTGVQHSHGAIASAVSGALNDVLGGRGSTLGATSTTASTIADLLQKAAGAYAAGDEEGASRLKAAAEALEGKGGQGGGGTPATSGAGASGGPAASGGADMMGQMGQIMGQVGQQVGQLAQSVIAPLQGLAQGLQQVPQQIMQGVQQAAQSAQAAELDADEKPEGERDTKSEREDEADKRAKAEPAPASEAQAGQSSAPGRAPVEAPQPVRPAPTRPQVD